MKTKLTLLACLAALVSGSVASSVDAQSAARRRDRENRREERRDALRDTFTGWDRLVERTIAPTSSSQSLIVTETGRYDRLRLQVERSSVVLRDVVITLSDGTTYRADATLAFSASHPIHEIDLPGAGASVTRIDFNYSNMPSGQTAEVEVWGR